MDCAITPGSGRCLAADATRASQSRRPRSGNCSEETGLHLTPGAVLGVLDDYVTRSGYVMTPVVVWGGAPPGTLAGAASEVTRVYEIPLADLDVEPELLSIPESDAPVIRLPLLDRFVHAPTAAIIYQFCQVALHGKAQRVAHFEAPVFVWK